VLASLLVSFLFIRTSARLMRSPKVPWWPGSIKTEGGLHVHHPVFGIVLLLATGFVLALQPGSPWLEIVAAGFGIGSGLTLDEYALWLHLDDVYWAEEGRRSVDAVVIAAPWARRRCAAGSRKLARATRRYERHTRRYQRFQDRVAGAPAVDDRATDDAQRPGVARLPRVDSLDRQADGGSEHAAGDPRVLEHEAIALVHEPCLEREGGSRVRELLSPVVVGEALVSLLQPLDREIGGADVRGGRLRLVADGQRQAAHRECVGERRRLEVDVEAAVEMGRGRAVHRPAPGPVRLDDRLAPSTRRPSGDACAPRDPRAVQLDLVVDRPGHAVLDRGGAPRDPESLAGRGRERDLEPLARVAVPVRDLDGRGVERHRGTVGGEPPGPSASS
jgi:hypothetical protein